MFKLNAEGISDYNFLYGKYYKTYPVVELTPLLSEDVSNYYVNDCQESDGDGSEYENEYDPIEDLADRVWNLETNVTNIGNMIGEMFKSWNSSKNPDHFFES
jgi:hypothetical protein